MPVYYKRRGIFTDKTCRSATFRLYFDHMRNWDYDLTTLGTDEVAQRWKMERMINYGLNGEKLHRELLRTFLPTLNIPPDYRAFLALILS